MLYIPRFSQNIGKLRMLAVSHANNARITQRGRTYILDGNPIESPPVSEAVKQFYRKFEAEKIAATVAQSNPMFKNKEDVIRFWASKRDYGTDLHDLIEKYYKGQPLTDAQKKELCHFLDWEKNGKPIAWQPYWCEQAIWCPHTHDDKITAGRIDMLYSDGNKFYHVDWKFVEKPNYDYNGIPFYCNCKSAIPFEATEHTDKCKAIGPAPETKHLLMYKWASYAGNNSLYCEMLRRNYGMNVVESWLVFLHPKAPSYTQQSVDFDAHRPLIDAILGKQE